MGYTGNPCCYLLPQTGPNRSLSRILNHTLGRALLAEGMGEVEARFTLAASILSAGLRRLKLAQ